MTSHLTLRQRAAQYWNRNLTGWTAHSPTAAAISQGTASAGPTSPWPVYWLFLPDPRKCRYIGRCLFPALSLPTANAGAIGRWCARSHSTKHTANRSLPQFDRILLNAEALFGGKS